MEANPSDPVGLEEGARFVVTPDEKNMAVICHLSAFAGLVVPLGNVLGPLVVWLLKREEMPFVDDQGKEALNFQITMSIAFIAAILLVFVVVGILVLPVLGLFWLVVIIMAAVRTSDGRLYRYPFSIKFIS